MRRNTAMTILGLGLSFFQLSASKPTSSWTIEREIESQVACDYAKQSWAVSKPDGSEKGEALLFRVFSHSWRALPLKTEFFEKLVGREGLPVVSLFLGITRWSYVTGALDYHPGVTFPTVRECTLQREGDQWFNGGAPYVISYLLNRLPGLEVLTLRLAGEDLADVLGALRNRPKLHTLCLEDQSLGKAGTEELKKLLKQEKGLKTLYLAGARLERSLFPLREEVTVYESERLPLLDESMINPSPRPKWE